MSELQIVTDRAEMTGTQQTVTDGDRPARNIEVIQVGSIRGMWTCKSLPQVGDKVKVTMNGLGDGQIMGFFPEAGYIGVKVQLFNRPDWHRKQNPNRNYCLVFGAEIACYATDGTLVK